MPATLLKVLTVLKALRFSREFCGFERLTMLTVLEWLKATDTRRRSLQSGHSQAEPGNERKKALLRHVRQAPSRQAQHRWKKGDRNAENAKAAEARGGGAFAHRRVQRGR